MSMYLINPYAFGGISNLPASVCADWDATLTGCYAGSGQTFSNRAASPADGSSQTANDLYLGATSGSGADDPAFVGSAGTSGAKFTLDSSNSQFFSVKSAANTTLMANLHKTSSGSPFWMACAINSWPGGAATFFGTKTSAASSVGIRIALLSSGIIRTTVGADGVGSDVTDCTSTMSTSTPTLVIVSADFSLTSNNLRIWINTRTKEQLTLNEAGSHAGTTAANHVASIMALANDGTAGWPSGTEFKAMALGNTLLDDATAAPIFNTYNARHGVTYA